MAGQARMLLELVRKDFTVELRERFDLWVQAAFVIASGVLVSYAASASQSPGDVAAGGVILVILFLGLMTGYSAFAREAAKGTLEGLRLTPVDRSLIILSKLLFSTLLLLAWTAALSVVIAAFTLGLEVLWAYLLAWVGAVSLFMGAVSSFTSAALSFGEVRAGSLTLLLVVLSIPVLRLAYDSLLQALTGVSPGTGAILELWGVAGLFSLLAVFLGGAMLE